MAQIDDLKTAVTEQTTAITEMQTRVEEDITNLQAELANAGQGDNPEISTILESIKSNTQSISTLDPVIANLPGDGAEVTPPGEAPVEPEVPADAPANEVPTDDTGLVE